MALCIVPEPLRTTSTEVVRKPPLRKRRLPLSAPSVLFFFNIHKSPRHNALGVSWRGRPADSAMMADAAGRPPPGLGPRRSGFRHVGGRSSFGPFSPVAYSC